METLIQADIFFFIASIAFIIFSILLFVFLVYAVFIMRDVREVVRIVRRISEGVENDIATLRNSIKGQGKKARVVIDTCVALAGGMFSRPQPKRKKHVDKKEEV